MPSVLRQIHTANSAAKVCAVELEKERTIVLFPSISDITFEILFPFPWQ